MNAKQERVKTGLSGLDSVIDSLRIGDNVVWNVPSFAEYAAFVRPFIRQAQKDGRKLCYIRFADHPPLIENDEAEVFSLEADIGFGQFAEHACRIIKAQGRRTFYIFDCLSYLLSSWASDNSVANFFRIICPYLYKLDTVAFFAVYKNHHSFETISRIRETTQVMIELYNDGTSLYAHPQKVFERTSPTMFLPHRFDNAEVFTPVKNSLEATSLFRTLCTAPGAGIRRAMDAWDREFIRAEALLGTNKETEKNAAKEKLVSMLMGKDQRIIYLINRHFSLSDMLEIKNRMIGTGCIGGKSVGFLLARKILDNRQGRPYEKYMEPHDSFYIGSDVFHSFIVHNGWWGLLMEQKTPEGYFRAGSRLERLFPEGGLPPEIKSKIKEMLDYFGQYPIIIRSSSLLEDGYGNAFAGKYESFFCSVMGTPEERYEDFFRCMKLIYASSMSRDALEYRRSRGLEEADEQMSLLVQRVSGSYQDHFYYPHAAGVGLSYNTYVWNRNIDPEAGMLRIVMGLGTRAVNRVEGDYPRIVSLSDPELIPLSDIHNKMRYSQRDLDVLDVRREGKHCVSLMQITKGELNFDLNEFALRDFETERRLEERGRLKQHIWILTFQKLLRGSFPEVMKNMMNILEAEYKNPVEIEFTLNFTEGSEYVINLLQCRPVQKSARSGAAHKLGDTQHNRILLESNGHFMGGNVHMPVHWLVFVDAEKYSALSLTDKYTTAKTISIINKSIRALGKSAVLFGPGRWGTSTPSLGVPIVFADINSFAAICEMEYDAGGLYPELSFGSHFFQDLVENGTFYMALFTGKRESVINFDEIARFKEISGTIIEAEAHVTDAIKIYDTGGRAFLNSDIETQKAVILA
ncbi:PEP/pyruvate-binding domain-containing protein [Geovibrio thiophilus]|nr:PEP/pyruvate-binding domain-containing protein [Geovibrio thiophilus]